MRHLPVQAAAQFDLEPVTTARPPATSAFQKRGEYLLQFLERHRAFEFLAIDEEGRCRVDLQLIGGKLLIGLDLLQKGFIPLAGFDGVSVHPEMAGNRFQGVERSFHEFALALEKHGRGIELFRHIAIGDAVRQHGRARGRNIKRKGPRHEAYFAGVDIFRLRHGKDVLGEGRAMRTGHRGIFDDGDRRLGGAQRHVGEHAGLSSAAVARWAVRAGAGQGRRVRRQARQQAREETSTTGFPSVQAAHKTLPAARRSDLEAARLADIDLDAVRHQADRHDETNAGQNRDRLERLVGNNRGNAFHGPFCCFAQTGVGGLLLDQNS
jgi:hypothetical protein